MSQGEIDLQVVDKGGGPEAGETSKIVDQDGVFSHDNSKADVSNVSQQVPLSE